VRLKEIYTTWTFSETRFYFDMLMDQKIKDMDQLRQIEDPMAMMLMMLFQRLK